MSHDQAAGVDESALAELQDATAAFYLNLRTAMKEIVELTTQEWIDGERMSQTERMDRIETLAENAILGTGDVQAKCGFSILEHGHSYRCTKTRDHG